MEFKKHHREYQSIISYANKQLGLIATVQHEEWTASELEILCANYILANGLDICVKLLPTRSRQNIKSKANRLGLKQSGIFWTAEEILVLKKYYIIEGKNILNRLKNKTWRAVQKKARSIGLQLPKAWSEYEISILLQYYTIEYKHIIERLPNKTWAAIQCKAGELGLKIRAPRTRKTIRCIETGEVFKTIAAAKDKYKVASIYDALCGKSKTAGGYHWEYIEEESK